MQNDIALIKLKRPINSTRHPHISPMCLSPDDENVPENFTLTSFAVNTVLNNGSQYEWLQTVSVQEYSFDVCKRILARLSKIMTDSQLCGLNDSGMCPGSLNGKLQAIGEES